jgi:sensor histidine kinase regulating citrate/malate metabolism
MSDSNTEYHDENSERSFRALMTKTHVEKMGGRIYLESKVNKGVIFTTDYPQPD